MTITEIRTISNSYAKLGKKGRINQVLRTTRNSEFWKKGNTINGKKEKRVKDKKKLLRRQKMYK